MKRTRPLFRTIARFLLYLAISFLASGFWTWLVRLFLPDMPHWASGIVFLILFFLSLGTMACIGVGTSRNLPAVRKEKP